MHCKETTLHGKSYFHVTHVANGLIITVSGDNKSKAIQAVVDAVYHSHRRDRAWLKKRETLAIREKDSEAEKQPGTSVF